ncbi:protein ROOT HAIR DEFECTIVE 3-like [Triticum dicoccoides]|uniref:protein ROOT HAIR DEFECTIVE 3-like n=1 Tax=Triticum dicoccoides TaxID=85692 RepID=UPI00188FD832|nr:protein ROOT HAIR DEFECTIVE 3-like [Triticum dicoccoides]
MGDICFTTQIIGKDGVLDIPGLDKFTKDVKLNDPYAVVSIVGAQSSGKSTLMNHLFGTDFQEMNTNGRRSQTTNGIWLAKAKNIEPCTLVMDLEGTDGKERGVDDTSFEKQSALFALAVSDVILINMWCHDIGREHAGNRPLLKTVFQVLMRLFDPHKKTMLFVIRDKTKTPFENIVADLREDIQQIWDGVQKPQTHTDAPLSDFFNIQFEGLSNYEENPDLFKNQVSTLRNWFRKSIGHAGPSGNQHGVVPASGFSYSTNEIWKCIKEDKDLNLPKHKVMVATVRCGQISSEKVAIFIADQDWKHFKETVQNYYVPGFGKKISTLLDRCLSEYDMECIYYDDGVRTSIRQQLESEILKLVYPAYKSLMKHLLNGTLKAFEESFHKAQKKQEFEVAARDCTQSFLHKFTKGCEDATIQQMTWDPATFENKLKHAIDAHVESVRVLKLKVADLCGRSQGRLTRALAEPVDEFLRSARDNTWEAIKTLLVSETIFAAGDLKCALLHFEPNEGTMKELLSRLENHGRSIIKSKAKEEAATVSIRMKDRFTKLFNNDAPISRVQKEEVDIKAIAKSAQDECMMMLWIILAIRSDGEGGTFENFRSLLLDEGPQTTDKSYQYDPLSSISWKMAGTLISPVQCKSLWSKFMVEVDSIVKPARDAQIAM